jgi:hypothetical protein
MIDIFLWMMSLPQFWLQVMWVGSIVMPIVLLGVFRILK